MKFEKDNVIKVLPPTAYWTSKSVKRLPMILIFMVTLDPQLGKLCETAHPSLLKIHIVFFALFNEFLEVASFMTRLASWCQTPANHLILAKCKKPRWSNTLTSKGKWFGWLHYCVNYESQGV